MNSLTKNILKTLVVFISAGSLAHSPVHATPSFGQASDVHNIGAGARAMGMGGAFTGLADDASASYYNPAGLAFMDENQLMFMHAPLFIDSNYNYIATANPLGDKWGAVALADSLLVSDGFEIRDNFNQQTEDASMNNNTIYASYARKLTQKIAAGLNAKFLQQKVVGYSDNTLGFDLGIMYRPTSLLTLGAALANANSPEITLNTSPDVYRPIMRYGASSQVFRNRLLLSADIIKVDQQSSLFAAGIEYTPNRFLQLRTGYNGNRSYTLGMGVNLKPFRIDYAFSDTDLGAFNKVSFTWAWHNIYKTEMETPVKEGRSVYPLSGFENQIAFKSNVPNHVVANWTLVITDKDGQTVRSLGGDLRPPETIVWDAKNSVGEPVVDGSYNYKFDVNYKNGKSWTNDGTIALDLPTRKNDEVIDMNLQLNGAREGEMSSDTAATPAPLPVEIPETPAPQE